MEVRTIILFSIFFTPAQIALGSQGSGTAYHQTGTSSDSDANAEQELQEGTDLTRHGAFKEAIPHLLAAHGRARNEYAGSFNLALCYVATGQPQQAIPILNELRGNNHDNADVNNLLAQAYVGDGQDEKAFEALRRAASLTSTNEKLYMFVADACMDKQNYALGSRIVELGLQNLLNSPRLHFERAMFLSLLDEFDSAKKDFELAQQLAPNSDVAFEAGAQEALFAGDVTRAVWVARDGIAKGHNDFMLLALLGEALLRAGPTPGQAEFEEARQALEKSIQLRPNYSSSQLAIGKLYMIDGHASDAITHLEIARRLSPNNPAVYSQLATAYRKHGDLEKAQDALAKLASLNEARAQSIRTASGERKASYANGGASSR